MMKKIGFISLGCPKNLVDSEVMMGHLKQSGYQITANAEEAETIVVNTCGFIDSAKQESIEAILEATQLKTTGKAKRVVVAGCLVELYRDEPDQRYPRRLRSKDKLTHTSGVAAWQSERDISVR